MQAVVGQTDALGGVHDEDAFGQAAEDGLEIERAVAELAVRVVEAFADEGQVVGGFGEAARAGAGTPGRPSRRRPPGAGPLAGAERAGRKRGFPRRRTARSASDRSQGQGFNYTAATGRGRETVALAAQGLDAPGVPPEFFAQAADVGVDGAGVDGAGVAPDLLQQRVARLRAAPAFEQQAEQLELGGRQVELLAVEGDLEIAPVDDEFADGQPVVAPLGPAHAPQHGFHPQDEFARAEGLGHVIVRADFQPGDALGGLALGGEHQHGDRGGVRLGFELAADLLAVHVREHQVEHDEVGPVLACPAAELRDRRWR